MTSLPHHLWFAIAGMEVPAEAAPIPAPDAVKDEPAPVVCPEVWNTKPVDADRTMDAVHAMCRGGA